MEVLIPFWIISSLLIGLVGRNRKIGFLPVFLISLVGSPALGFIAALCSKRKDTIKQMIENQELQMRQFNNSILNPLNNVRPQGANVASAADELLKLKNLLDQGVLTQVEYEQQKARLLA